MNTQYVIQNLDKIAYLEALIMIGRLEEGINQKKMDFIEMQAGLLGVDINPLLEKTIDDISDLKTEDMSRVTKMSIIRDSISFAYIDGCYTKAEQEGVYKISDALAIDKSNVDAMESWLKEYWLILHKGNELLGLCNN